MENQSEIIEEVLSKNSPQEIIHKITLIQSQLQPYLYLESLQQAYDLLTNKTSPTLRDLLIIEFLSKELIKFQKQQFKGNRIAIWVSIAKGMMSNECSIRVEQRCKMFLNKHITKEYKDWHLQDFEQFLVEKGGKLGNNKLSQCYSNEQLSQVCDYMVRFFQEHNTYLPSNLDLREILARFILSNNIVSEKQKKIAEQQINILLNSSNPFFLLPSFRYILEILKFEYKKQDKFKPLNSFYQIIKRMDLALIDQLMNKLIYQCEWTDQQYYSAIKNLIKTGTTQKISLILLYFKKLLKEKSKYSLCLKVMENQIVNLIIFIKYQVLRKGAFQIIKHFFIGGPIKVNICQSISKKLICILQNQKQQTQCLKCTLQLCELIYEKYSKQNNLDQMLQSMDRCSKRIQYNATPYNQLSKVLQDCNWIQKKITSKKNQQTIYRGMANIGNTCYMNSFVQALYMTLQFRYSVLSMDLSPFYKINSELTKQQKTIKIMNTQIIFGLQKLFGILLKSKRSYIVPNFFKKILPHYFRFSFLQHDASEFGKIFLQQLQQATMQANLKVKLFDQLLEKLFIGEYRITIQCKNCNKKIEKQQKFMDVSLHSSDHKNQKEDLSELICQHFEPEELVDQNKYFCQKCEEYTNVQFNEQATKECRIHKIPNYLILTVNRFTYDKQLGKRIKLLFKTNILNEISLSKYIEQEGVRGEYLLYGIIVHKGFSAHAGHYFTYAGQLISQKVNWVLLDDSRVQILGDLQQVRDRIYRSLDQTPYLYFYASKQHLKKFQISKEFMRNFSLPQVLRNAVQKDDMKYIEQIEEEIRREKQNFGNVNLFKGKTLKKDQDEDQDKSFTRQINNYIF